MKLNNNLINKAILSIMFYNLNWVYLKIKYENTY